MTDGLLLMALGMGTVMAFLVLLVLVMNVTAVFFKRRDARLAERIHAGGES